MCELNGVLTIRRPIITALVDLSASFLLHLIGTLIYFVGISCYSFVTILVRLELFVCYVYTPRGRPKPHSVFFYQQRTRATLEYKYVAAYDSGVTSDAERVQC